MPWEALLSKTRGSRKKKLANRSYNKCLGCFGRPAVGVIVVGHPRTLPSHNGGSSRKTSASRARFCPHNRVYHLTGCRDFPRRQRWAGSWAAEDAAATPPARPEVESKFTLQLLNFKIQYNVEVTLRF